MREDQDVEVEAEEHRAVEYLQLVQGLVEGDEEEAREADNQVEIATRWVLGMATHATAVDNLDILLTTARIHNKHP
jgi:hypothetical protein